MTQSWALWCSSLLFQAGGSKAAAAKTTTFVKAGQQAAAAAAPAAAANKDEISLDDDDDDAAGAGEGDDDEAADGKDFGGEWKKDGWNYCSCHCEMWKIDIVTLAASSINRYSAKISARSRFW